MRFSLKTVLAWSVALMILGCSPAGSNDTKSDVGPVSGSGNGLVGFSLPKGFGDYWYQGKAEVNRYVLTQARYGELREGDAVLVFVTEDFLGDKQVKLESAPAGRDIRPMLKLNMTKKFITGIYPYSMMTSVFTPVELGEYGRTLKVTTSSQEWCGHTFTQLNLAGDDYRVRQFSYFEKEADIDITLPAILLEDELWTRIRLAPDLMPTGEIDIIPATMTARLRHTEHAVVKAQASISDATAGADGKQLKRYTVEFTNPKRTLSIDFEKDFPHAIAGWKEAYEERGKTLTTTATRTNTLMIDYWSKNATGDTVLRKQLGLD